jgi:PAS domain S-box-containing protein
MGERIRAHDWAATPLGPIESWPVALRIALDLCLHSKFPTAIYWGEELILLYNDAWAPIPAEKHPWALGRPAREVWADIWDIIEPQLASVLESGEGFAVYDQLLPMERGGEPQETYWNYSFSPIRHADGIVGGVLNQGNETTAIILAQRALRASEERLQLALGASNSVGTWDWDVPSNTVTADERFARLYGVPAEVAAKGAAVDEFFVNVHPDDLPGLQQEIRRVLATGEPFSAEYRLCDASGSVKWVIAEGRAILDSQGQAVRFPGVTFDISERKAAEAALRESEERFRGITNSIAQMVWSTRPDGYHDFYNRRWYEYTGVPEGSTDGEAWNGMFHPEDQELAWARWRHSLATGQPYEIEYRLRHRSGQYRWVLGRAQAVRDESGRITRWFGTCTDIQELVDVREALSELNETLEQRVEERTAKLMAAEEQLRQSQKMDAIGRLTGGIAHDFNNMLAVVIGGLNLMQRKLARGDTDVGKYVDAAMDGAMRAAGLTQRLLAFSRQQPLAPTALDPNELIGGMAELLSRALGEPVKVELRLAPGLWRARADARELENVILNLAVNARDAMHGEGTVLIETANESVCDARAGKFEIKTGDYVRISVIDHGEGMSDEVKSKAFDPFFTTKPVGRGTGLGLSQVFGFVSQSGGHVAIDSAPGEGTTISLYLPRSLNEEKPAAAAARAGPVPGGTADEIILVVEDEERVRNYSVEALRELGYTVVHAASGSEALGMIEGGQAVTLLFTDIVMPEMTGRELAERARATLPDLKLLYTTGYARDGSAPDAAGEAGIPYLAKPFDIEQLGARVRAAIDD